MALYLKRDPQLGAVSRETVLIDLFVLLWQILVFCPLVVSGLSGALERWGALFALEVAWTMGISHLILELVSSSAVALIKRSIDNRHPYCLS